MRTGIHQRRRPGFTLVELMVSAAICVIIMTVMATAFQISIDTMRQMRSHTDLADQLRAAGEVIKADLQANHFLSQDGKPDQGLRVSDQRLDQYAGTLNTFPAPAGGFFRIVSTSVTNEGADTYSISSTRRDGTLGQGHLLHFTSIRPAGPDQNLYAALVNGSATPYTSSAAEIALFLDPSATGSTGTLPVYNLIRRQRLVAINQSLQGLLPPTTGNMTTDPAVISLSTTNTVNLPSNLVSQTNRLGGAGGLPVVSGTDTNLSAIASAAHLGDDILLSNVISFEVKVNWTVGAAAGAPNAPRGFAANTDSPFDTLQDATGTAEFDTRPNPPLAVRVMGVQIRIRIWDPKVRNARQFTIAQNL